MHQAAAELLSSRIWLEEIFRISRQLAEPKHAGQRYRLLWRRQQLVRRCLAINRRLNTMPPAGRPAAALPLYPEENLARRGRNVRLQSGASGLAAQESPSALSKPLTAGRGNRPCPERADRR